MKITEKFPALITGSKSTHLAPYVQDVSVINIQDVSRDPLPTSIVVLANELNVSKILRTFENPDVQHVVQTDREDFFRDIIISCMLIKKPEQFLVNPIPFFVNNFDGSTEYEKEFRSASYALKTTEEKSGLVEELKKFLSKTRATKNMLAPALLIADELVANAFFNAPVDEFGKHLFRNQSRDSKFKLARPVRVFIAHDSKRLVIGCQDGYGSINKKALLDKLNHAYAGERAAVDADMKSAGLGCRMMIDRSLAFYVVSKRQQQTLVFCALELGKGEVRADNVPKNIHLCFW